MVDPDYTLLAVNRFSEGMKAVWGKIFQQVDNLTWTKRRLIRPGKGYPRQHDYPTVKVP